MSNFEMQGSFLNGESLPEGSPAKTSASPDNALDLAVRALDSSGKSFAFLTNSNPDSSSSKTYLVYCPPTTDEILEPSSGRWLGGGMGSRTGFLTLNTSEWPREGAVCSLSDVLETTGAHLAKYSLSPKACAGILRRAERRGKKLPPMLERALRQVSSQCEKDQRGGGKGPLVSEDVSLTLATGNGQVLIANPLGTKRRLDLDNETYVTQERERERERERESSEQVLVHAPETARTLTARHDSSPDGARSFELAVFGQTGFAKYTEGEVSTLGASDYKRPEQNLVIREGSAERSS